MKTAFILSAVLVAVTLSQVSAFEDPCTQENWDNGQTHFAYPPDNTKFIQCTGVKKYVVMPCGSGTVWSSAHTTCVMPNTEYNYTPEPTTTTPAPTTTPSWTPVCDGSYYIEDPCDNTVYFQCANNIAYRHTCPTGLWWNIQVVACDWPELSGRSTPAPDCRTASTTLPPTTTTVTLPPTTPVPLPPTLVPYCPPDSNSLPFADPCVYRAFFQCANGVAHRFACSGDLEFDNALLVCNWAAVAQHDPKPANCPARLLLQGQRPQPPLCLSDRLFHGLAFDTQLSFLIKTMTEYLVWTFNKNTIPLTKEKL